MDHENEKAAHLGGRDGLQLHDQHGEQIRIPSTPTLGSDQVFIGREIGLSGIAVLPSHLRALRPDAVATLASSMKAQGLLQPIVVRPSEATGYYLVAGRQRYEAARSLGWQVISARILAADDADHVHLGTFKKIMAAANAVSLSRSVSCALDNSARQDNSDG
jgi:hypothetical protein